VERTQIFDLKGAVVLVELVVEFGVAAFNTQAMSMIRQALPLPSIPAEIESGSMSFRFRWGLQGSEMPRQIVLMLANPRCGGCVAGAG
jgi:hypothetical protein